MSVIQAAKKAGATDIVGVDLNESKFKLAEEMVRMRRNMDICISFNQVHFFLKKI